MSTKLPVISGAEFLEFYHDKSVWTEGTYHDDTLVIVDGVDWSGLDKDLSEIPATATVKIDCGFIVFPDGHDEDLVDAFNRWKATRAASTKLVIDVPHEKLDAVRSALTALGIEING
ncbi:hypothetical protein [Burkholderia gladioli]|uniref:hypothetical protein n=1 Tax=Burkholderia gladioli TaxID=28095 RepID=UPI00163E92EB|nr:hypothetical protein [Burkholderia gladioli]